MTAPAAATPQTGATGTASAGTTKATVTEGTQYVILASTDNGVWTEHDKITARSTEGAIRAHGKPGTYIAIPARSFRPVTVKAETTTVLKIEAAK